MTWQLSPTLLRPVFHVAARWAFAPELDWPARRRRSELVMGPLPAPSRVAIRQARLGDVPVEVLEPAEAQSDVVLLFLHGGGFTVGSPRTHRSLAGRLAARLRATTYVPDYRLAPEHPYPAAVEDVLAAYRALLDRQTAQVLVAGDSAGGTLTLALALAARECGLPQPAALGMIYPAVDFTPEAMAARPAAAHEPTLTHELLDQFTTAYIRAGEHRDPLVSPLLANLAGLAPMVIDGCADDLLLPDARALAERAKAAGVPVRYHEHQGLFHGFHSLAPVAPRAARAVDEFAQALRASITPAGESAGDSTAVRPWRSLRRYIAGKDHHAR